MAALLPGLPSFLAGKDLWRFPPARFLFLLARVLPVERRREGAATVSNESVFAACHEALAEGAHIALVPRGRRAPRAEDDPAEDRHRAHRTRCGRRTTAWPASRSSRSASCTTTRAASDRRSRSTSASRSRSTTGWSSTARDDHAAVRDLTDALADRLHEITLNHAIVGGGRGDRPCRGDHGPRRPRPRSARAGVRGAERAEPRAGGRDRGHGWRGRRAVPAPRRPPIEDYRRDVALLGVDDPRAVPRFDPGLDPAATRATRRRQHVADALRGGRAWRSTVRSSPRSPS